MRDVIRKSIAWAAISLVAIGLMIRDLWLFGELRGGHVWRLEGEGEWCVMCGLIKRDEPQTSCRRLAIRQCC